jgi:alkylation response protein AidB-like acyl-CoA dehydrogenase
LRNQGRIPLCSEKAPNQDPPIEALSQRPQWVESAFKVPGEAVQALGGAGYTKDWPVDRYMRDAKLLDIGAGTNEIRRMLIGA